MGNRIHRATRTLLPIPALILASTLVLPVVTGTGDPPERRVFAPVAEPEHPVAVEIQDLHEAQHERVLDLVARGRATKDPADELEIQREIQRVKVETEIAMYEAQLRHAERRGDAKTAETLRSVLAAYENLGRKQRAPDTTAPGAVHLREEVAP